MAFSDPGGGRVVIAHDMGNFPPQIVIKTGSTIVMGDVIDISDAGGAVQADSDLVAHARAVALNGGSAGDYIGFAKRAVVKGYSGATVGGLVYSSATAGSATQTKPTIALGYNRQPVGMAIEEGVIFFDFVNPPDMGDVVMSFPVIAHAAATATEVLPLTNFFNDFTVENAYHLTQAGITGADTNYTSLELLANAVEKANIDYVNGVDNTANVPLAFSNLTAWTVAAGTSLNLQYTKAGSGLDIPAGVIIVVGKPANQ